MVNNIGSNNACTDMTSNIHKGHDQLNTRPILIKQTENTFTVFLQNICDLLKKREELLNSLTSNSPQIICITEHHLADEGLEGVALHPYILEAKFCRRMRKCGGVCIFIQDNIQYTNISMDKYSNEKDIEICAMKLHISSHTIVRCLQISIW